MKNFLIRTFVVLSLGFVTVSCLKSSRVEQKYIVSDDFDYSDFNEENKDGIYHDGYVYGTSGVNIYNITADDDKKSYLAGFTVSSLFDPVVAADHVVESMYSVSAECAAANSKKGFAVYYQYPVLERNVKNDIVCVAIGDATALSVEVCNTAYLVNLAKYGTEDIPSFREGDYLTATFNAYRNDRISSSQTIDLIRFDGSLTLKDKWEKIDLKDVGIYEYIDIVLESNRTDIPLYFCIDEFFTSVHYYSE